MAAWLSLLYTVGMATNTSGFVFGLQLQYSYVSSFLLSCVNRVCVCVLWRHVETLTSRQSGLHRGEGKMGMCTLSEIVQSISRAECFGDLQEQCAECAQVAVLG